MSCPTSEKFWEYQWMRENSWIKHGQKRPQNKRRCWFIKKGWGGSASAFQHRITEKARRTSSTKFAEYWLRDPSAHHWAFLTWCRPAGPKDRLLFLLVGKKVDPHDSHSDTASSTRNSSARTKWCILYVFPTFPSVRVYQLKQLIN